MPQQNNMMMDGEVRPGMTAPDETLYNMPPETSSTHPNQWIYGNPNLNYSGQSPTNGVDSNVVYDTVPGRPNSSPLLDGPNRAMPMAGGIPGSSPAMPINGTPMDGMPMNGMDGMNGEMMPGGMPSDVPQSIRMKNPVNMELTHMPTNNSEAYQASLRSLLHRNIGYFIIATFLVGTQQSVTWQGILHTVGSDYIVLYQPNYERYISCDLYALKFVQFHNSKGVPYCAASQNWQGRTF